MPKVTKQLPPSRIVNRPSRTPTFSVNGARSAWDLTTGLKVLLYGQSGTGKTTLWATFPKPILALICSGGQRPGELRSIDTPENRKAIDARIVETVGAIEELLADAGEFATVVLDHVSGLQDLTLKEILGIEEIPAQKSWGMATQQQYGQSTLQCKEILRQLLGLGGHVVIIGQERTFGGREDGIDPELVKPTVGCAVTPSLCGWLNPACDYVLQTFKRPRMRTKITKVGEKEVKTVARDKGVDYCLRCEPHDVFMTKFRVPKGRPLPDVIVDPSYDKLASVISET